MLARTWTRFAQWNKQFGSRPLPLLRHIQSRGPGWDIGQLRKLPNYGFSSSLLAVPGDLFSLCLHVDQDLLVFRFHFVTVKALRHFVQNSSSFVNIFRFNLYLPWNAWPVVRKTKHRFRSLRVRFALKSKTSLPRILLRLYEELRGHPPKKLCNVSMFHFPRVKSFFARYQLIFLLSNVVQQSISTSRHSWRDVVVLLISKKSVHYCSQYPTS